MRNLNLTLEEIKNLTIEEITEKYRQGYSLSGNILPTDDIPNDDIPKVQTQGCSSCQQKKLFQENNYNQNINQDIDIMNQNMNKDMNMDIMNQNMNANNITYVNLGTTNCTSSVKAVGNTVVISATGSSGTAPYNISFYRNGVLLGGPYIGQDGVTVQYPGGYQITSADQTLGYVDISSTIVDSCTTGAKTDNATCRVIVQALPTTGSISCASTPSGAQVWLDNINQGQVAPVTLTNVSAGSHTVTFKLTGYNDCPQTVNVTAGGTVTASCIMTPTTVTICTWLQNNGGIHPLPVANITVLIMAYLGYQNIGFSMAGHSIYITGAIMYYLGQIAIGNSQTGCSFV